MTTHPHPEMIDPRQWCSACGIHVASEVTPQSPAIKRLCPACGDERNYQPARRVSALLDRGTTSGTPTLADFRAGYDLTFAILDEATEYDLGGGLTPMTRGGAMPAASYDGGRTWHPLPFTPVGPLTTEEIRGQVDTAWQHTIRQAGRQAGKAHRLGGYPYVPRLHPPTIDD